MKISCISPTHNPKYLAETAKALREQTFTDFEWVIVVNNGVTREQVKAAVGDDAWIQIFEAPDGLRGIGAIKKFAFSKGVGDSLVEMDHDDILTKDALKEIAIAFEDQSVDFVYSNFADFNPDFSPSTFGPSGEKNGWQYKDLLVDGRPYKEAIAWGPSAASMSYIWYAPNHVRAWRKAFYDKIGGHNSQFDVADDHELVVRTYLQGKMKKIDKCLYLYRMGDNNTWSKKSALISELTSKIYGENIEKLVLRDCEIKNLPAVDLGGAFNSPAGWTSCDLSDARITADLREPWPFEDESVGAFRAVDLLEHLPDKQFTMSEIHRCLVPGGFLLSMTPSTDGRGAFMDPTHVSFWNQNSFWYWTRQESAKYIGNEKVKFIESYLGTGFPTLWHEQNNIPYVTANLIAMKGDMSDVPGFRQF